MCHVGLGARCPVFDPTCSLVATSDGLPHRTGAWAPEIRQADQADHTSVINASDLWSPIGKWCEIRSLALSSRISAVLGSRRHTSMHAQQGRRTNAEERWGKLRGRCGRFPERETLQARVKLETVETAESNRLTHSERAAA